MWARLYLHAQTQLITYAPKTLFSSQVSVNHLRSLSTGGGGEGGGSVFFVQFLLHALFQAANFRCCPTAGRPSVHRTSAGTCPSRIQGHFTFLFETAPPTRVLGLRFDHWTREFGMDGAQVGGAGGADAGSDQSQPLQQQLQQQWQQWQQQQQPPRRQVEHRPPQRKDDGCCQM